MIESNAQVMGGALSTPFYPGTSMATKKALLAKVEKAKAAISKQRDELRELQSEVEDLSECCDEAVRSLEDATDALSKYL